MANLVNKPLFIAPPFTFNPMKHHLGFIREFIRQAELFPEQDIFGAINSIGPHVTDLYFGQLSIQQIISSISSQLIQLSAFNHQGYLEWIGNSGKDYNFMQLPDGSKWTFRVGEKAERYVHFHPGRLSFSIRVRGNTLRTALGLRIMVKDDRSLYQDKEFINRVRQHYLGLSPIKNLIGFTAISKVLDLMK